MSTAPSIFDDLRALNDSMEIATGCIDTLLNEEVPVLTAIEVDHLDMHLVELKTCLERVERHIVIQQVANAHCCS